MPQTANAAYFLAKADQCFRLARTLRDGRADTEVAAELDAIANEFLACAVEIDTARDRTQTGGRH